MTFLSEKKFIENLARPRSRSVTSNITDDFSRTLRVSSKQVKPSQYRKFTTRKTVAFGLTTNVIETENNTRQLQRKISSSSRSTTPLCTASVKDTEEAQKSMKNGKDEIEKLREENAQLRKTTDELRSSVANLTQTFASRMAEYEAQQKDLFRLVAELSRNCNKSTQNENGGESSRSEDSRSEMQPSTGYSFAVPLFSTAMPDGAAYRKLVDDITTFFGVHLKNCQTLLTERADLPEAVAEDVRVAVGRTQLLMKKRLSQFNQQLERHLNPAPGEKITTLNDLHGLWSLIDIQLEDIRHCFENVEESRLRGWKAPPAASTLTTASSMPSLRLHHVQSSISSTAGSARTLNGVGGGKAMHKMSADETTTSSSSAAESLAREKAASKRRQDDDRRRQEFIRAKRAELAATTGASNNTDNTII